MADEADITTDRMEVESAARVAELRRKAASIPPGEAGECGRCGEEPPRLVGGACARCRDKFKLP